MLTAKQDSVELVSPKHHQSAAVADSHHLVQARKYNFTGPTNIQQIAVVNAMTHAWAAYRKYAWGHDELKPVSKSWQEWMGIGLTIVDSIDTLYIMGLDQEYGIARDWILNNMSLERDVEVQMFEITIRALGGLLSIYHLSADSGFLMEAIRLGEALFPCFSGITKIPCNRINMKRQQPSFIQISTAEAASIQLEFRDLARSTKQSKFEEAVSSVSLHLHSLPKLDGLVPCFLNPFAGTFHISSPVSVGASADSYYEYLLKQWIQTGKTQYWLRDDYVSAVEGMKNRLLRYSEPNKFAYIGSYASFTSTSSVHNEMEHLACFLPGTLALGVIHGLDISHLDLAKELMRTCYEMYHAMPTGLSPEVAVFNMDPSAKQDISVQYNNRFNIHRPETAESLFYMFRLTNDTVYRDWGWKIFQAFENYTRLAEGYASIENVQSTINPGYRDKMETFYLAETLKYFYLLFSDDRNLIPLDEFVFNTEAHPLPVYSS
jgi:mannosyl-oligosaccharide alpha-1,2-mannosidase